MFEIDIKGATDRFTSSVDYGQILINIFKWLLEVQYKVVAEQKMKIFINLFKTEAVII